MDSRTLTFPNASGTRLAARLDLPADREPIAFALFAHCFTCSKNLHAVGNISAALTAEGIAVLRFDFTGLGESEGDFAETSFSSNVEDIVAAAEWLSADHQAPTILIGHSLGGAAVLQAAASLPSVRAVATIGAPCDPSHVSRLLVDSVEEIEAKGEAVVSIAGRRFTLRKQFLDDLNEQHMKEAIGNLRRALLVFHAPLDDIVGIENAARIFEAAKHPKSFVSLDTADHLLTDQEDSRYVGTVTAAWARKYIGAVQEERKAGAPDDNRIVARIGRNRYRTELLANGHSLVADEPYEKGGANLGPTPYDLLVAGLGACTAMTLRMYADHKQWPLEGVSVRLRHSRVHAEDCRECPKTSTRVDVIEREIHLLGDLDTEQQARLLQIADRCPVHKTLQSDISIRTSLKS